MRIQKSLKNISMGLISQFVLIALGFISRKVFIDSLGIDYLGINGLLTNILSMLSLVEGGIGTSIVYNLYKPLSENNTEEVRSLIGLYRKIYRGIALGVFILSLGLFPIVWNIIKIDVTLENFSLIFFIFVFNNIIFYFNAHKWSLINADQKGYILEKYNLIFSVSVTAFKIIILYFTQNYILFLLVEFIIAIIQNIWNGKFVSKHYPYIKGMSISKVSKEVSKSIVKNSKAVFLHNVGTYCVFGTDNLLISIYVNIQTVGVYSTYSMIVSQLTAIINAVLNGVGASVGNLLATENSDKSYDIFNVLFLINFWLYSVAVIFLYNLLETFITWFYGDGLLLARSVFIVILINMYLNGMRSCILTFKSKAGMFQEDKYIPLLEAALNLIISIVLVKKYGLIGVFIGTTISTITVPFWTQAKLVYNKIFNKSFVIYLKKYLLYTFLMIISLYFTKFVCDFISFKYIFIQLCCKGVLSIFIPSIIYATVIYKKPEYNYLVNIMSSSLKIKKVA